MNDTDLHRVALAWTWWALIAWVTAGCIRITFGAGTPLGGIASLVAVGVTVVAGLKTFRARRH